MSFFTNLLKWKVPRLDADGTALLGANGEAGFVDAGLFGASPSASAAVNTAAIQAVLDIGGLVTIRTPGDYNTTKVLLLDDDTTLSLAPGVRIVRSDNAYMPVVMNRYCGHLGVANIFTRASNVVTVAQNNHPYAVGQSLYISGGPDASYRGVVTISAVATNSWSYASAGDDGTAGTNGQFYNVIPVRESLAGTAFVRASNYVTVTQAGHGKTPGLLVYLATTGASTDFAPGIVEVTKITSDTWTYRAVGSNGTASGTIITSYNREITIDGGVIDGNRANQLSQTGMEMLPGCAAFFGCVTGLTINSRVGGGNMRAMSAFNCADVLIDRKASAFDCLAAFQFEGGLRNIVVDNTEASDSQFHEANPQKQDDYVAFTGTVYAAGAPGHYDSTISPYGLTYFSGIDIRRALPVNALNGVKLTADASCPFKGVVRIGSIQGRLLDNDPEKGIGSAVRIMDDGPGLTGTTIDTITVEDVVWTSPDGSTANVQLSGTGTIKNLLLYGAALETGIGVSPSCFLNQQGMTVQNFTVDAYALVPYDSSVKPIFQFLGGTTRKFTVRNTLLTTDNSRTIAYVSGGTVNIIELLNCIYGAVSATGGKVLDIATAGVKTLVINGAYSNESLSYHIGSLLSLGNAAHAMDVYLDNIKLTSVCLLTTPGAATGAVVNVYCGNVKWTNTSGTNCFQFGTGTWNIFAGNGLRIPDGKLALFGFGTPTWRLDVKGDGAKVNMNDAATYGSASLVPQDGDELFNSTTGTLAVGRHIRRSGAWTAI